MVARQLLSGTPHAYKARVTLRIPPVPHAPRLSVEDDFKPAAQNSKPIGEALEGQDHEEATGNRQHTNANPIEETLERTEHGYILLTLVSHLEKTFRISPDSMPLDGSLRIVHFGPQNGEVVEQIMGAAYDKGRHVQMKDEAGGKLVGYEGVESARIEILERDRDAETEGEGDRMEGRWRRICVDGLIVRVEEGGWMEVAKMLEGEEALDVVVPD
jgi:hypothetical protein